MAKTRWLETVHTIDPADTTLSREIRLIVCVCHRQEVYDDGDSYDEPVLERWSTREAVSPKEQTIINEYVIDNEDTLIEECLDYGLRV